ncbi:3beta-hydroxysteroid-dehydrogenase/decarboxylase-like isoform X1 [Cynara cardunculus var. scolymus]|uniref:Reticulon-like protein n=1 Tax=Cynara cardunculus var. scolymus TaxID=59895 RepID=A0A103YFM8_CYNCS|nr:3beta-hydroxysteroid-dehydrogenase/decarboxylase-like isoform X1 [Cynara cardunculus var. scolymus]KVI08200.1 3-beta hydroxysteroid dehydrogenase/isomerase [Cynara cardunculus var. scolymus]
MAIDDDQSKTCVVLGGRSFIGRCLVVRLLKLGNWIVRVADSAQSLQLDPSESKYDSPLNRAFSTGRASYAHVDLRHKSTIINAIEGSEVVFYMDDIDSCNHDFYFGYSIIVRGVKNVVNACRRCKVKRLIYNSTADVVFDNSHDIISGNETLLYSSKFKNLYCELKSQAEAHVLLANDIDGLLTCALRPSNVFGPGDKFLLPSLIEVAKSGWAKFIIGSDQTISDFTYVENVAHALVCAEVALASRMFIVSGKVFFITNFEPARSWQFALCMLEGLGYYRPIIKLPAVVVRLIVFLIKWMHSNMNFRDLKHVSVHNVIQLMSHTRTYNCSAAERHIEYSPIVSLDDGITLTVKSFTHLAKDLPSTRLGDLIEQSKMEELLGSGEVADILLWRDERRSFLCFLGVGFLYYWFCVCERRIISSTAYLLLLLMVVLSGYARLSPKVYGCSRMSPRVSVCSISRTIPCFEVSEMCMRSSVRTVANIWNAVGHVARSLAEGSDWSLFFKVVVSIYLFKLLIVNFFPTSLGLGLAFSFILFFVYEQYDVEIDGLIGIVFEIIRQCVVCVTSRIPVPTPSPLCINTNKPAKLKDQS